jgi:hypothetical protein
MLPEVTIIREVISLLDRLKSLVLGAVQTASKKLVTPGASGAAGR